MSSSKYPWRNVAITGAAGFVGSTLVRELVQNGINVIAFDILPLDKWTRVNDLLKHNLLNCIQLDIKDDEKFIENIRGQDILFHLAAATDMARGAYDQYWDLNNGILPTIHVLVSLTKIGGIPLVYTSSSAVYGLLTSKKPAREIDGPLLPISTYGAGKLAGEGLVSSFAALHGFPATIIRPGTIIGRQMDHGVIPSFIAQVKKNGNIKVLGDGAQARSFIIVEELVKAMLYLAAYNNNGIEVYNISSKGITSVSDIAKIVVSVSGIDSESISFGTEKSGWKGDVPLVALDIGKLLSTGWNVSTSDDSVKKVVEELWAFSEVLRDDEPNKEARSKS
ncbi:MAG: NAD-dependent epimerase/dehydratase family protein [bacterium]